MLGGSMTKARKYIYDENLCAHYHSISRIVQGAFLMGFDEKTGINYDYRLQWIEDRLKELSEIFTIIIGGKSFMSNHFHINLQTRPDLTASLTDREVVQRYFKLHQPKQCKKKILTTEEWKFLEDEAIANETLLKRYRKKIGSLSEFMKALKEPIARRANKESNKKGHFWDSRFKSILLIGSEAVALCQVYIDSNPIRAGIAETPETSKFTSAHTRLQASEAFKKITELKELEAKGNEIHEDKKKEIENVSKLTGSADWLAPFYQGENHLRPFFKITEKEYFLLLDNTVRELSPHKKGYMDPSLDPIFDRLKIDREKWLEAIINYDKWFYRIIGKIKTAWAEIKDTTAHWFKGSVKNRHLFGD